MKFRHRRMERADIAECVELIAHHPVSGPRYGSAIELLPEALCRLLETESFTSALFYAGDQAGSRVCCVGIGAIVHDAFVAELKAAPHFWIGPEMTRRIVHGESPLLSARQLREQNSRGGLNVVHWEPSVRPGSESKELQRSIMKATIEAHRGYLWKEIIGGQQGTPEHLDFLIQTGGFLWDAEAGEYVSTLRKDAAEIVASPYVAGTTRELERRREGAWTGSWIGTLFDYRPPELAFTRSEQRLLSRALDGETDERLSELLAISLAVVKKTWNSIYWKVEDRSPELFPVSSHAIPTHRGREKRRTLLHYLREHPEELRPYSPKLVGAPAPVSE
jgi:hypothetical protein